jgi:hypothetical protein
VTTPGTPTTSTEVNPPPVVPPATLPEYAKELFAYVQYLNQLTNSRAQALLVANTLLISLTTTLGGSTGVTSSWPTLLAFGTTVILGGASTVFTVASMSPMTKDVDYVNRESPMHSGSIGKCPSFQSFSEGLRSSTDAQLVENRLLESFVVSKIVERRTRLFNSGRWLHLAALIAVIGYGAIRFSMP